METNSLHADVPGGKVGPDDGATPFASDNRRLQRILDYESQALANTNVLESNLAIINGGLLKIALRLAETIDEAMASSPVSVERMQRVYQAIDTHLRVARQIDRFAQIELRSAEPGQPRRKARVSVDIVTDDPSGPVMGASEDLSS